MRVHTSRTHRQPVTTMLWRTDFAARSRIEIGAGAIENLGPLLSQVAASKNVLLLTQEPLLSSWGQRVQNVLAARDLTVKTMSLPDGESAKTPKQLIAIWEQLEALRCQRSDTIIACGGGALCDLAGFAASTYVRGMNLILIPTTLLGQVDAAIGGKTAINLRSGKNLAGTFYFPQAVVIDPDVLETLPAQQVLSGLGEIIKYALIESTVAQETQYKGGPRSLLALLESCAGDTIDANVLAGIITACVKMKLAVVAADPHEAGLRRCLNLGHTLAHALEKRSRFSLLHGNAVAIGSVFACQLAARLEMLKATDAERVVKLVRALGLPDKIPAELADSEKLTQAMAFDKKMQAEEIKFVLPTGDLGTVDYNYNIKLADMRNYLP